MPIDPEDIIDDFQARVGQRTQQALDFSAQLEQVEATVRSAGGEVTVRVDSAGGLVDLRFHAPSETLSRDELAALVLATSRRAQTELAEQVSRLVAGVYGSGSGTAAFVTQAYASRYPRTHDEREGSPDGN